MAQLLHTFDYYVSNTCEAVFVESASCLIPFTLCWYCAIQTGVIPNRIRKCTVKSNGSYEDKWSRYASHWYIIISHLAPAAYINNIINFTNWPCNMPNSIMLSLSDSHLYNVICSNGVHRLLFMLITQKWSPISEYVHCPEAEQQLLLACGGNFTWCTGAMIAPPPPLWLNSITVAMTVPPPP